jgi:N-acetylglucosamine-6-phosphate deacetylase
MHARVVTSPGVVIDDATILIEKTSITSVGPDLAIPPGYMSIDCSGRTIYPGLIDAYSEIEVDVPTAQAGYWNRSVTPERAAHAVVAGASNDADKLRGQGFTTRVVAPQGGIVKGSSAVVLLGDDSKGRKLLKKQAWHHLQLTVPRRGQRDNYPNSPMGAVALLRQSMYDALWYTDAWTTYRAKPSLPRPETNIALETLAQAMVEDVFVVDAPNERMALRAENIAKEFSLQIMLRGSGREYRRLGEIAATERPVLVPVDFPDAPNVSTAAAARNTTLEELMHWDLAAENPARLCAAGITICLTTDGLDDVGTFWKQVHRAVDRGLPANKALAAMTTVPADLLGIGATTGRVQAGMLANLVITNGDLFDEQTKILETWVAGQQFVISPPQDIGVDDLVGRWKLAFSVDNKKVNTELEFQQKDDTLSGSLGEAKQSDDQADQVAKLSDIARQRDRLTAAVSLSDLDEKLPTGKSLITLVTVKSAEAAPVIFATVTLPSGVTVKADLQRIAKQEGKDDQEATNDSGEAAEQADAIADGAPSSAPATPVLYPLGAYGLEQPLADPDTAIFRGATIWTCDQTGVITGDVLIRDGKIVAVGESLAVPADCLIIDGRGKHITPGLIDCHSHMATDGGVNESGQAVTAEVRIGDFIDNSDINIYRQLAGGLTTSNILHGSANPIGGQNQVIKLRWGDTMEALRMAQAPGGIKLALGENVKRNQSRYPNTRMGVEQIIRDQLLAAREYDAAWRRWREGDRTTLPPRIDLQLEALAEVQRGTRWIHCHSYRQDEIVATLDVLEEFGIQIGTLQHILEGYKVADRMAKHGAMGSAFSDWWAYKFEVFDAIPFNGALMHQQGVVVSFNSDDRELARHLNTEAAKATKYGGVPAEEALKFVTLNPARQLRIDDHVGSITPGKDADLVVWSGRPLSTTSRCEQTWIDGKRYFDLESDHRLRQRDAALHAGLVQKVLRKDEPTDDKQEKEVEEEDRWDRHDAFCGCHGDKAYGGKQ